MNIEDVRPYEYVVAEPFEYTDNTLQTASWWDRYEIQPGTYPVEWINIDGTPWDPTQAEDRGPAYTRRHAPYYGRIRVDAVLTESYRVNRLLHVESAEHRTALAQRTTVTWSLYGYSVKAGPHRGGEIREVGQ